MKYLSVCSGIEAASCAWHSLGWTPVAFSEIEKFPSAVLAHHYPTVPNWGDMTKFQEWPDACVCGELPRNNRGSHRYSNDGSGISGQSERGRDDSSQSANGATCEKCGGTVIDLLVGGTPCQSFSVAGLRKGLADPRGNLALTYLAIADKYRPEWLVWENVPGVLSSGGGRDFGSFLGGLGELGYGWAYRVLDAQYFGLAQRRKRVFVVASLGGWQRAAAVLFDAASLRGDSAPRREAGQAVASVATSGFECGGTLGPRVSRLTTDECAQGAAIVADIPEVVGTLSNGAHMGGGLTGRTLTAAEYLPSLPNPLTARMGKGINTTCDEGQTLIGGSFDVAHEQPYVAHTLRGNSGRNQIESDYIAHALRAEGFDASEDGTGRGTPLVPVGFYQNEGSHGSGDNTNIAPTLKGAKHSNFAAVAFDTTQITSAANYSNPKPGDPCHPLASGAHAPAVATAMQVRRLTPRECERLQGFPDDYTLTPYRGKPAADGPRYKALGNSMAVPVMHWIGKRIQQVQDISKRELA